MAFFWILCLYLSRVEPNPLCPSLFHESRLISSAKKVLVVLPIALSTMEMGIFLILQPELPCLARKHPCFGTRFGKTANNWAFTSRPNEWEKGSGGIDVDERQRWEREKRSGTKARHPNSSSIFPLLVLRENGKESNLSIIEWLANSPLSNWLIPTKKAGFRGLKKRSVSISKIDY